MKKVGSENGVKLFFNSLFCSIFSLPSFFFSLSLCVCVWECERACHWWLLLLYRSLFNQCIICWTWLIFNLHAERTGKDITGLSFFFQLDHGSPTRPSLAGAIALRRNISGPVQVCKYDEGNADFGSSIYIPRAVLFTTPNTAKGRFGIVPT